MNIKLKHNNQKTLDKQQKKSSKKSPNLRNERWQTHLLQTLQTSPQR